MALGISATIAISASAAQSTNTAGNLPPNEMIVYTSPGGPGNPVPPILSAQQQVVTAQVGALAAALNSRGSVPLEQGYSPTEGEVPGPPGAQTGYQTAALAQVTVRPHGESITQMSTVYVATPAVLSYYGIDPSRIRPDTDVITSDASLQGLQIFAASSGKGPSQAVPGPKSQAAGGRPDVFAHPTFQIFRQLPVYSSDPVALITVHALRTLGLQTIPSGWLIRADHPLTTADIDTAQKAAAAAGLIIETRQVGNSGAALRNWSTTIGILVALGVLAMTVGLIRSETANDLRTLAATGAGSWTRRTLTAATAAALGLLGALLGTAGAYAALLVWHRSHLSPLSRVPVTNLVLIVAGLPLIALVGGWLLAGRQPPEIAHRPLD
jgi:putative ABC transport system permease protein